MEALKHEKRESLLDAEKINVYKAQIKVLTEDFQREHERAEKLVRELAEVKVQLQSLQGQQMREFADRRQKSLENYELQYYQNTYGDQGRLNDVVQAQKSFVPMSEPRYNCKDGGERSEDVVDSPPDDVLECPKCNKQFKMENHDNLIKHLDNHCK